VNTVKPKLGLDVSTHVLRKEVVNALFLEANIEPQFIEFGKACFYLVQCLNSFFILLATWTNVLSKTAKAYCCYNHRNS
jgi:hypothetical protein